jgi:hypothetical protein
MSSPPPAGSATAALGDKVSIVIFGDDSIAEGEELRVDNNVYLTRPDNFNQLRALLGRGVTRLHQFGARRYG